jgi:hypothetical protein
LQKRLREKKLEQAIILSAVIFPGSGHFLLKRYFVAVVLISVALMASYFLISEMMINALTVVEEINQGIIKPNISAIAQALAGSLEGEKVETINISAKTLMGAWLIGIADCFRISRNEKNASKKKTI